MKRCNRLVEGRAGWWLTLIAVRFVRPLGVLGHAALTRTHLWPLHAALHALMRRCASLNMWLGRHLDALLGFLDTLRGFDVVLLQECTSAPSSELTISDWDLPCRSNLL